jgi:hypothetical protein
MYVLVTVGTNGVPRGGYEHPNFDLPDNFLGSPSFGSIRSAQSPRRVQFSVKLLF